MATMTNAQKQDYLDAYIRREARWKLRRSDGTIDGGSPPLGGDGSVGDVDYDLLASEVYDCVVSNYDCNDILLGATAAVEGFSVAYVKRVVKAAVKTGVVKVESVVDSAVRRTIAEAFDGFGLRRK